MLNEPDEDIAELRASQRALIKAIAKDLRREEARDLIQSYYQQQKMRLATVNRIRAAGEFGKDCRGLEWLKDHLREAESFIYSIMDTWSKNDPSCHWSRSVYGIGPVLSSALSAYLDVNIAKTASAVWRYCGLDPTLVWAKGQKRPYNAEMKTICWRIGDSFVKFSGNDKCFYGKIYRTRKELEEHRNNTGMYQELAFRELESRGARMTPEQRAHYTAGHLPPGRIDLRARRTAVKMFLAHWFETEYPRVHGRPPPRPWIIEHGGHDPSSYVSPQDAVAR